MISSHNSHSQILYGPSLNDLYTIFRKKALILGVIKTFEIFICFLVYNVIYTFEYIND